MFRNWLIFCLLLFPIFLLRAQDKNEYAFKGEVLQPGTATSISFKIENATNQDKIYDLSVDTNQKGITPLLSSKTVSLSAGSSMIYIVPVRISNDTPKGNYLISLKTKDEQGNTLTKTSPMVIAMARKLSLSLADSPEFAKAGDSITVTFIAKNNGNMAEKLFLKTENAKVDLGSEVNLLPGQSRVIRLKSKTDPNIGIVSYQSFHLNALTENHPKENLDAFSNVKIIPVNPIEQDIYRRFPIAASINYIGRNERGQYQNGIQAEVFGRGSLSKDNTDNFEFRAVTKNPVDFNVFTPYEEYYASYKNEKLYAHIGDKSYSASFLTEFARYGRGAELQYKFNKVTVGAFYNHPRFYQEIKDEFNVSAKYQVNRDTEVSAGYLYKIPRAEREGLNTHLPYILAKTKVLKSVDLQTEISYSKNNYSQGLAYLAQAQGNFNRLSAGLLYMNASPDFAGYFNNTSSVSGNFQYRLSEKIDINGNYRQDARNFKRDTLFGIAPYQKYAQLGLQYRYSPKTSLNIFSGYQNYDDHMQNKQFSYDELFVRAGITQEIGVFRLGAEAQYGRTNNFLTDQEGNSKIISLNAGFEKFRTSFNFFGSYSKTTRYIGGTEGQLYYGARIISRLSLKSSLSIFYQNNYMPEQVFSDRNLFEVLYHQDIFKNHSIDLTGRYTLQREQLSNKDFIVSLRYTMRINTPVKKIADYVTLSGNVSNLGVKKVDGVKLIMGNHISITDKEGNYTFKNVIPGDYYIEIDRSTTDFDVISDVTMPAPVHIVNKENFFNFGLTNAAKIEGFVKLSDDGKTDEFAISANDRKKSESIIIEATKDDLVVRKICQLNESFDFTYLQPGSWKVKIYRNGLDKRFKIAADSFEFDLKGNETKAISVNISKQQREIKFQQNDIKVTYNEVSKKN
ncbi:hypothetical protein ASG01_08590 [Chryseobacterium sp. Leaf180]|uniref:hypothetical protein n=1 Tax=Chryseobacterium sp. Leaf180 TaxID=1736289 RepID=UPI00070135B1|nr:hypothetical protein [Chryseobacterium sp. Leaf180]KQR93905.1 hypothetical protein ASG01_08590 [Chryseobacterium sp. Leaf180]